MAAFGTQIKLLNEDGSLQRFIGRSEMDQLIVSERVSHRRSGRMIVLRLKPLPAASDSRESSPMPTLAEICIYAERRRVPEEIRAKVEACAFNFPVRQMEFAAA